MQEVEMDFVENDDGSWERELPTEKELEREKQGNEAKNEKSG